MKNKSITILLLIFSVLVVPTFVSAINISIDNMVSYFPLNASNNLTDYFGRNNLTLNGSSPVYIVTPIDNGYNMTGSVNPTSGLIASDSVSLSADTNLTIGGIFYFMALPTSSSGHMVSKYYTGSGASLSRSYYLGYDSLSASCVGNLSFLVSNVTSSFSGVSVCGNTTPTTGEWHDVVAVFVKGTSQSIYLDGVLIGQVANSSVASRVADGTAKLGIGSAGNGNNSFPGIVEEAFVDGRAWNSSDIALYHQNRLINKSLLYDNGSGSPPVSYNGTVYYYNQSGGDDGNNCSTPALACKTISDMNGKSLVAKDSVLFACGETWRLLYDAEITERSGNASGNVTYGSYGNCNENNKPLFTRSINSSTWTETSSGSHIWKNSISITDDVGVIVFNDGESYGLKQSTLDALNVQGEFYYNASDDKTYLYSSSNPATYYYSIELSKKGNVFDINSKSYIVIRDLAFKYSAKHGIFGYGTSHHIYVINNSLSWIGGAYQTGTVRYGNGIEIDNSNNIYVGYNKLYQVYDACLSNQDQTDASHQNYTYEYNICDKTRYGYEFINKGTSAVTRNILVDHNTFVDSVGFGNQSQSYSIRTGQVRGRFENFSITNNIMSLGKTEALLIDDVFPTTNLTLNYNLYYQLLTSSNLIDWQSTVYTGNQFSNYKVATGKDANSLYGNPLLASDYVPASNSPACDNDSIGGDIGALSCLPPATDSNNPLINSVSPINVTVNYNYVTFICNVSDDLGLYSSDLYINDTLNSTNYLSENGLTSFFVTLNDGNYSWYCTVRDLNNNTNQSNTNLISIDTDVNVYVYEKITGNLLSGVYNYLNYSYEEILNKGFSDYNSSVNSTRVDYTDYGSGSGEWREGLNTYFNESVYVNNVTIKTNLDALSIYGCSNYVHFEYSDGTDGDAPAQSVVAEGLITYNFNNPEPSKTVTQVTNYMTMGGGSNNIYQDYQMVNYYKKYNLITGSLNYSVYNVKSVKSGYIDLYTDVLLTTNTTLIYGMYDSELTVSAYNSWNNETVTAFGGYVYNDVLGFNESFTTITGFVTLGLLTGYTYGLVLDADYYVLKEVNVSVVNVSQSVNVSLFAGNSIYIEVRDETTGNLIPSGNVLYINDNSTGFSINSSYLFTNLSSGSYSIMVTNPNYTSRIYELTVNARNTHNVTAYLLNSSYSASYVVFSIIDANNGGLVTNASMVMSRLIGSTWQPVESKLSDVSGKVQLNFQPLVRYQFVVSKSGYETQLFYLNPILYTSYNIRLEAGTVATLPDAELTDVNVVYGGTSFTADTITPFTFSISSAEGSLTDYNLTIIYPGGIQTFTGSNALGETFTANISMDNSSIGPDDYVNITYCYYSTLGEAHCYSYSYDISGYVPGGSWKESAGNTFGLGLLERLLIVTLAVILVAGFFTLFVSPIAGGVLGLFLFGFFTAVGFVPIWAILPSILVGFFVLSKRGGP